MPARDLGRNQALIGQPGSRSLLQTPALVIDLAAFEANLQAMAGLVRAAGRQLRPHAKAHKSPVIARMQLDAGAVGISCVAAGELEMLAAAGIPGILVTSPIVLSAAIVRLVELARAADGLMVVADSPANVAALGAAAEAAEAPLGVLVDVDVGQRRTGVTSPAAAVELARLIDAQPTLRYRGVQAYYGHLQHVPAYEDRRRVTAEAWGRLSAVLDALRDAGLPPEIVSGGGTGTAQGDLAGSPFTEIQPGSYLFMDAQYGRVELGPAGFSQSLFVLAHVVSANHDDLAVIDAGLKAFATEAGPALLAEGAPEGATYRFMGDEHGGVVYAEGTNRRLKIGDAVLCVPPHCDPTVNLYDRFHIIRGDALVDIWPIEAGRP